MVFYSKFIPQGGLVFDIGAYCGSLTRQFLYCNPRMVVAIEPQVELAKQIRSMFLRDERVRVENCAITDHEGIETLYSTDKQKSLSTINLQWTKGRFSIYDFDNTAKVHVHTLDYMFSLYGIPDFIKIDAEGSELSIIKTLTREHQIRSLCFEYMCEFADDAQECIKHMNRIGDYEFNYTVGDYEEFHERHWLPGADFGVLSFYGIYKANAWGMIYARLMK